MMQSKEKSSLGTSLQPNSKTYKYDIEEKYEVNFCRAYRQFIN